MPQEKSNFELLREKNILSILDGDVDFSMLEVNGIDSGIRISRPYLSGPTLCDISNKFGLPTTCGWSGSVQSRWAYLDDLLEHCIQTKQESNLLAFLFSKGQFVNKLRGQTPEVIEYAYTQIGKVFDIRKLGSTVSVAVPFVKTIDRSYITDLSDRAMKDVVDENYDIAITKSRTLLEEVFCYIIERKGENPSECGDIGKLYNQVKQLYKMHQSRDMNKSINGLLSGQEKILSAIAEMRNKGSDFHGVGAKRISIADHSHPLICKLRSGDGRFCVAVGEKASL